ncbi:MAG: MFS transporter [Rhodospirillaceae bacterium]|nr:MFS transporter [Rhodospirillaceae bacterium]
MLSQSAQAPADPPDSYRTLLFGRYALSTWAVCLGVGLHALTWFMVATVVPSTVIDLGGARLMGWTMTAYLAASIVAGAAGGWTKRRLGARTALNLGAAVYLVGSAIALAAPTMSVVLVGRGLQGLGEGLVVALSYAMVREIFPSRLVPRVFGLEAVVWAGSALAGPVVAGLLTGALSWRAAFGVNLVLGAMLIGFVRFGIPRQVPDAGDARLPLGRLTLVGGGILVLSLAGNVRQPLVILAIVAAALGLLTACVLIDRTARTPLFPRRAFHPGDVVGRGFWLVVLMPIASTGLTVYMPLFVQTLFGFTPTGAGYFATITALAWSGTAIIIARFQGRRLADAAIALGPVLQAGGMAMVLAGFGAVSVVLIGVGLFAIGSGYGISWAFINQRIMQVADPAEGDLASALMPTLLSAGSALGAAIAGALANFAGIADPVTADMVHAVSAHLCIGGLALAGGSVVAGWRFSRVAPQPVPVR